MFWHELLIVCFIRMQLPAVEQYYVYSVVISVYKLSCTEGVQLL